MWSFLEPANLRHTVRVGALMTVVMTVLGPFGTYEALGLGYRLLYWSVAIFGCAILFDTAVEWAIRAGARPLTPKILIGAALGALPACLVILALETLLREGMIPAHWPWLYVCVFIVGAIMSVLSFHPTFATRRPRTPASVRFLERLPEGLGEALDSLSMNDHYVEVFTDKGSEMIHMRFKDALGELGAYPGLQIHRSHWVALGAIEGVSREGRSLMLRTKAGRSLPVSATFRQPVLAAQARGWMPDAHKKSAAD